MTDRTLTIAQNTKGAPMETSEVLDWQILAEAVTLLIAAGKLNGLDWCDALGEARATIRKERLEA